MILKIKDNNLEWRINIKKKKEKPHLLFISEVNIIF